MDDVNTNLKTYGGLAQQRGCHVAVIDETPESGKTVTYDCRITCEIAVILRICLLVVPQLGSVAICVLAD
jgi:hypothetical protein